MMKAWCRVLVFSGAFSVVALGSGCCRANNDEEKPAVKEKSSGQLMIEGVTGKAAVDAGEKMKAQIEDIAEKQNAALNEVLEE
jgi:hypothetical protein